MNGIFQYLYSLHLIKYYLENTWNYSHLYAVFPPKPKSNIDAIYHTKKKSSKQRTGTGTGTGTEHDTEADAEPVLRNPRSSMRMSTNSNSSTNPQSPGKSQSRAALELSLLNRHTHSIIPCKYNTLQLISNYLSYILTYIHNEHIHESYNIWGGLLGTCTSSTSSTNSSNNTHSTHCTGLNSCIAAFHRSVHHLSIISDKSHHYNVALVDIMQHTWVVFLCGYSRDSDGDGGETAGETAIVDLMHRFHSLTACLEYYNRSVEFSDAWSRRTDASRTIKHINDVLLTITPTPLS